MLFYDPASWISRAIDYLSGSDYSHTGMIIVDPPWIAEKGVYLIQSGNEPIGNVEDGTRKFGVCMFKFSSILAIYPGRVAVRHLHNAYVDPGLLATTHHHVHELPYNLNPIDWIRAGYLSKMHRHHTGAAETDKRFWCSALVAYIYVHMGWLPADYDYTYAAPSAFGRFADELPLLNNAKLSVIQKLK